MGPSKGSYASVNRNHPKMASPSTRTPTPNKVLVLEGVGLFFPCGHGYVKAVDPSPAPGAAAIETALVCPRCSDDGECLACGGVFSGRWCDFCTLCTGFWNFAAWVDYAIASGARRIRFRQGMILVPAEAAVGGGAETEVVTAHVPWPALLTLGEGDVELVSVVNDDDDDGEDGGDGDGLPGIDALATLKVMDQVDHRGRPDASRVGERMTRTVYSLEHDVRLGSDEGWLPPEPTLNFSRFEDAETGRVI
ncbi:hypothetical protein SLS62_009906 [Diatrype stigma]|uniref:Uncharacterized protein n=1 Tax=Diatrype stigma TaxID=117547 RepID=A0AAN9UKS8_9PEZI